MGTQLPSPKGGRSPPIFGPYLLWPNGWIDQDATWYGERTRPRQLCVRQGPNSPSQKGGGAPSPIFSPCPLWPNGWVDQDGTWHRGGLHCPGYIVLDWDPAPLPKRGRSPLLIFGSFLLWTNDWMHQDATRYMEVGFSPGEFVSLGTQPLPKKGAERSLLHNFKG